MMVQALIPNCSPASKTDEILSRYRPIAPKPELPPKPNPDQEEAKMSHSPYLHYKIPYLRNRNTWAHLQARPSRSRKRGRNSITPTLVKIKSHQHLLNTSNFFPSPPPLALKQNTLTLPLLSSSSSSSSPTIPAENNTISGSCGLEEKDLVLQLKSPTILFPSHHHHHHHHDHDHVAVITPKAVRPIGSTIRVGPISMEGSSLSLREAVGKSTPEGVEVEAEAEALPVLITDSKNRVRMANSAYKELLGQPECRWLDGLSAGVAGRRISGEVTLQVPASVSELPGRFSCWARIEWGNKRLVDAFCDVVRLNCEAKDYLFSWRFHTTATTCM